LVGSIKGESPVDEFHRVGAAEKTAEGTGLGLTRAASSSNAWWDDLG